ncbi:MAG: hypothetical protein HGA67_01470 [Candidatus Yonathbacteria bacterium]|nr:hypothetical protein [Candidatus Yonathbacteria bacterium]
MSPERHHLEYPPLDTHLDNRTEKFTAFYGPLEELFSGPELGQQESSFGKDIDALEWKANTTIEQVGKNIDAAYGSHEPRGTALKIELLTSFVHHLEEMKKADHLDARIPVILGCARSALLRYMPEEYMKEDVRMRKTGERMLSESAQHILKELMDMVRQSDNVSSVATEQDVYRFLENTYERVEAEILREAVAKAFEDIGKKDLSNDADERWEHAFIALERFCETHFPGMVVVEENDDEDGDFV